MLTGKMPEIVEAISFSPDGTQDNLHSVSREAWTYTTAPRPNDREAALPMPICYEVAPVTAVPSRYSKEVLKPRRQDFAYLYL